ncbi:LOW QUALITY PROTEIN: RNA cytosine-C(5)-methyltransferase NSUN2-like [Liolophura sinensis]|uniref:LOW QUALITY PROTEIN: RNA cytosine-C(5)-methyltransferase NSUN2-like n=1 Tax=Liolophura sinensis TaxID=3198878 RepID=UPI00315852C8
MTKKKAWRSKRFRDDRDERGWRPPAPTENPALEKYYKGQDIVPEGEWEQFYSKLHETLPVTFRITGYKEQAQELLKIIKGHYFNKFVDVEVEGRKVDPPKCMEWYPDGLAWQLDLTKKAIRGSEPLKQLHEFLVSETESGNISRQEAVSMIPPILLDVKSHHKVLDLCAAPGSKTAQLIEYLHSEESTAIPEGFVVANDNDNKRCYLMTHQVKRLQSPNCMIINHDATILPNLFLSSPKSGTPSAVVYDRVLADVPCSGDGTLRKNPDVWRKWNPTMGMNLHGLQLRVLKRGLELLAVGGRLVYSTCSLNPVEDEAVISEMLRKCDGAIELVEAESMLPGLRCSRGLSSWKCMDRKGVWYTDFEQVPENLRNQIRSSMFPPSEKEAQTYNMNRCLRILPHHQDTGGFFIAVIHKTKPLPWTNTHRFSDKKEVNETATSHKETNQSDIKTAAENAALTSTADEHDVIHKDDSGETESKSKMAASNHGNGMGDASSSQLEGKRKGDVTEEAPKQKKQRMGMYKEDPFLFVQGEEEFWPPIKSFFGISAEFPEKQLMYRCADGKKRNLYFVSEHIKTIVQHNEDRVKFINLGVKIFGRSPSPLVPQCDFRLAQEGLVVMRQFSTSRRLKLSRDDLVTLLTEENPYLDKMSESVQTQAKDLGPGSTIFQYEPSDLGTEPACEIVVCGWKGKTSLRSFVGKFDRAHYLRLCGLELSEIQRQVAAKKAEKLAEKAAVDKDNVDCCMESDSGEVTNHLDIDRVANTDAVTEIEEEATSMENT